MPNPTASNPVRVIEGTVTLDTAIPVDVDIVAQTVGDIAVAAVDLDIRDLAAPQDKVAISDGISDLAVNADGSLNVAFVSGAAAEEFRFAVMRGAVPGISIFEVFGERESMSTTVTGEDMWRGVATTIPTPPDIGEQMTLVSSSDADNGATATGILTIEVPFLDATGALQLEIVTLNGTTPVDTVATDMRFPQELTSLSVGSNGVAEGDVIIYKTGSPTTIYCMIAAGGNQSIVARRMVPIGTKDYLMGWNCAEAQDRRVAFRIRSTDKNGVLRPGVFIFKDVCYLNGNPSGQLSVSAAMPALSISKVSGWGAAVGGEGSASYWGYNVQD